MSNRDRIIRASATLFNQAGVASVSTNHIAASLSISPGNLYFHFRNKAAIVRALFGEMTDALAQTWDQDVASPRLFLEQTFEVFWRYRFFHREMYYLRRNDPQLARLWRTHMAWSFDRLAQIHASWVAAGHMRPLGKEELESLLTMLVIMTSSVVQVFESKERAPSHTYIERGVDQTLRLLAPYTC